MEGKSKLITQNCSLQDARSSNIGAKLEACLLLSRGSQRRWKARLDLRGRCLYPVLVHLPILMTCVNTWRHWGRTWDIWCAFLTPTVSSYHSNWLFQFTITRLSFSSSLPRSGLRGNVAPRWEDGFLVSTIIPVPKSKRKSINCYENYRGIAQSSILGQVFDHILLQNNYNVFHCNVASKRSALPHSERF